MSRRKLEQLFRELNDTRVELATYDGRIRDAAFDVTSADSFVAGAAATLTNGGTVEASVRLLLQSKAFLAGSDWLLEDGTRIDLRDAPEIYALARLIEEVRQECVRCLGS